MAATAVSAVVEYLKRVYISRPQDLVNIAIKNHPFLNTMQRVDDFDGEGLYATINYALGVGASAAFATAQANWVKPTGVRIFLQRKQLYQTPQIKGELIHASRRNIGALLDTADAAQTETLEYMGLLLAKQAISDQAADIGRILNPGGISGSTITLANPADAINFHEGQWIVFNPTRTGTVGNLRGAAPNNRLQVSAVDDTAGTVTFTQTVATIAGGGGNVAVDDYAYIEGMYDQGGNGVPAFVPATAPNGSDSFLGATTGARSKRPNLLAGWRGTWRGTIEDSCKDICARASRYVRPGELTLWLSALNFYRLDVEAGARAMRGYDGPMARMGFSQFAINTPIGPVEVAMDPFWPEDTGYVLSKDWKLHTLLEWPHVVSDDGNPALRVSNDDSVETRYRGWHDFHCVVPGKQLRFPIV